MLNVLYTCYVINRFDWPEEEKEDSYRNYWRRGRLGWIWWELCCRWWLPAARW